MISKLSVSFAAIAAMGIAGAASAQETVNVNVTVQQIAELTAQSTATMVIDDTSDTFMGDPSSGGTDFSNVSVVELVTNYDVDAVRFTWAAADIGNDGGQIVAYPQDDNNDVTIFAVPQAGVLASGSIVGGGGGAYFGSGREINVTNNANNDPNTQPFGNGVHEVGIGVSTNWGNVFDAGTNNATFAPADTYVATFEATIVPNL